MSSNFSSNLSNSTTIFPALVSTLKGTTINETLVSLIRAAKNNSSSVLLIQDEDLILELEESVEGYSKEKLIWTLNLIITVFLFVFNVLFLGVYYLFPRIRKAYGSEEDTISIANSMETDSPHTPAELNGHNNQKSINNSLSTKSTSASSITWGCPNQTCLHLTWGCIAFLLVKVSVDLFFLKTKQFNNSAVVVSIILLRLLDASLVFNCSYIMFLWFKTIFYSEAIEKRSITLDFNKIPFLGSKHPTRSVHDAGIRRYTIVPIWLVRFFQTCSNVKICILSAIYGISCALLITLVFNVRKSHPYIHEHQAVKYSLLIQTFHVTMNLIAWAITRYKYIRSKLAYKTSLSKNIKRIKTISDSTAHDIEQNKQVNFSIQTTSLPGGRMFENGNNNHKNSDQDQNSAINDISNITTFTNNSPGFTSSSDGSSSFLGDYSHIPYINLSYNLWISIGNFIVYSPFLWFYLIALLIKPPFLNQMLNMQGLIGFLGTLFDLGACIPIFVATFHDKSLRLSFSDLIRCRFVGGRKSGNLELIT